MISQKHEINSVKSVSIDIYTDDSDVLMTSRLESGGTATWTMTYYRDGRFYLRVKSRFRERPEHIYGVWKVEDNKLSTKDDGQEEFSNLFYEDWYVYERDALIKAIDVAMEQTLLGAT